MSMSSRMRGSFACATLFLLMPHQVLGKDPARLTPIDYVEIQQLVNKLSFALDYCTHGGRDFADLFVKGGQFVIDEGNGKPKVFSSREQLIAVAGGPDCKANQVPPRSYVLHLSEGLVIEATPEGARGKSYAIYPANKGKYLKEDVAGQVGIYRDEYVRTPDGWRFKLRRHETTP
jgi:hypothetical protein